MITLLSLVTGCTTPVSVSVLPPKAVTVLPFSGIKNFDTLPNNCYRGGQPNEAGFTFLKDLGVKTILKLNTDTEGDDASASLMGLQVVKIPIDFDDQMFGAEPVAAIQAFWKAHPENVYVHCSHGQDRTGLAVYLLRRSQGWSKESATDEMLSHGFHKILFGLWDAAKDN